MVPTYGKLARSWMLQFYSKGASLLKHGISFEGNKEQMKKLKNEGETGLF
jgi:hypothetical protein